MAENYAIVNDDDFKRFAQQAEAEAKANNSNFGNASFQRDYEEIKWTGLKKNQWSIIRAVSGYPDSNLDNSTARTVTIAKIVDDNGKQMKVIRPSFSQDPNYILNKIISEVKKPTFVRIPGQEKAQKTFPVQEQHPEIYAQIDKNGVSPADKRYMFDKGWVGQEVLIMNVIDRAQMDWHRENKHTMLLAKSVDTVGDRTFVEEGISSFATANKLRHYLTSYGSWEKYDLGIKRTGQKDDAYVIVNATNAPVEIDEAYRGYISSTPGLTEEELSWERYDLAKLYRVTTHTKIYNRLKNTIKRIDEALGTHFLEELLKKVEEEKKLFSEIYASENSAETPVTAPVSQPISIPVQETPIVQSAPAVRPVAQTRPRVNPAAEPWTLLPYGDKLPDYRKAQIKAVDLTASEPEKKIIWDLPAEELYNCPNLSCQVLAPLTDVPYCPICGMDFQNTVDPATV